MNKKILSLLFASSLVLSACGGDDSGPADEPDVEDETEEVEEVEEAETTEDDDSNDEELPEGIEEIYEFNEVFEDNENVYVELLSIMRVYDEELDEEGIGAVFEVENKTDRDLEVQSRSVSINDRMVDDSLPELSQEVAAGKSAEVILSLESYDGSVEIPDLEDNFEMVMNIFDWDDMDFAEEVDIFVEL